MDKPFCPTCEREFDDENLKFCPYDASALVIRSADPMTGQVFDGRYRIVHKIGEGGMGAVYKATQESTGKAVAIKVISENLSGNPDTIKRFQREVKLQSKLEHPNIVTVIDFSTTENGQCYFVMGFVDGKSLRRMILDDGKFSMEVFNELAPQMLDGLEYAHNQGVIHRDLKADNMTIVSLKHQRIVKILDFGLAKAIQADGKGTMDTELTQQGRVLGTPAYMSPEQAKGESGKIGTCSDIYSMGVIFYHMLSGKLPFQSDTPWGVMHKHISETPPPLRKVNDSVPELVEEIIMRCLAKEPEDRYKSALAVKLAFAGKQADESGGFAQFEGTIAEATVMEAPAPEKKGSKAGMVIVLALLVLAGAGLVWKFYGKQVDDKPPLVATAPEEVELAPAPPAQETKPEPDKRAEVNNGIEKKIPAQIESPKKPEPPEVARKPEPENKVAKAKPPKPPKVASIPMEPAGPGAMFRGGAMRRGFYEGNGVDKLSGLKWRFETDDSVLSSPVVAGGVVYFGSDDGRLFAVELESGQVKWRFTAQDNILCSPAIAGDAVFFGSDDNYLYSVYAKTGKLKWKYKTEGKIFSSPAIAGSTVFFGSGDGSLYALDARTGKRKWKFKTGGEIESSPAVEGSVVYFGSFDEYFYAVDAVTGKLKWKFKTEEAIASSSAIAGSRLYFGSDDGHLYSLELGAGRLVWKYKTGDWVRSSPALAYGSVFFGGKDGFLYALEAESGKEKWRFEADDSLLSSPSVAGQSVYIGGEDGKLYAVDAITGSKKWDYDSGGPVFSSPAVTGSTIIFGSQNSALLALQ